MPTLKKLIKQIENNDNYIIEINQFLQQEEQQKRIIRGLKNEIPFESTVNEYKLTAKPYYLVGPHPQDYKFTITKDDTEFITGRIIFITKIQTFSVKFNYDYEYDLKQLNEDIVQLFKTAI